MNHPTYRYCSERNERTSEKPQGKDSLTDCIEYIIDQSDCIYGETLECLIEYADMDPRKMRGGIVACDVSDLAQFATLPGIYRIFVDTDNGFRTLWKAQNY